MPPEMPGLRRFAAARWGAPPYEPLRCVEAADDLAAARALVPDLTGTAALPSAACTLRLVATPETEWLVVEAEPDLATHGPFWAGFHARECAQLLAGWLVLRASPGLLSRPPPRVRARQTPTAPR